MLIRTAHAQTRMFCRMKSFGGFVLLYLIPFAWSATPASGSWTAAAAVPGRLQQLGIGAVLGGPASLLLQAWYAAASSGSPQARSGHAAAAKGAPCRTVPNGGEDSWRGQVGLTMNTRGHVVAEVGLRRLALLPKAASGWPASCAGEGHPGPRRA